MKKVYIILVILIILIFSFLLITFFGNNKSSEKVDLRGEIKSISTINNGVLEIYVEGKIEEDTILDMARVTVDGNTKIYKGYSKIKIDASDLKVSDKVEVTFTGPVKESYPVQGTASIIRVIN